jgi:hypothetical protein
VEKPGLAAAQPGKTVGHKTAPRQLASAPKATVKKSVDKPVAAASKPVTKPMRLAKVDPLAPLPAKHSGHSKDATAD